MEFTANKIASYLNGEVVGNGDAKVYNLSKIEEGEPGTLSFLSNPKYEPYIYSTKASIVVVNKTFEPSNPISSTLIQVENAQAAFAQLLELYNGLLKKQPSIHPSSTIDAGVKLGKDVFIGAHVYIGSNSVIGDGAVIEAGCLIESGVEIGEETVLYLGVKVYQNCKIGNQCTLHSGVVIGSDGFGFVPNSENNYSKVPQIGNVILHDRVEVGSNTVIDRATLGSTIIHKGVKLDNLIQIAHNVEIGENTVIAAQTGIAGSTKIGKNCMIGGQVGFVGHIKIADGVKIAAQSGIGKTIKQENSIWQGSPAIPIGDYKRAFVLFKNFPTFKKQLDQLTKELKNLGNLTL